ncbi:MAG TPA: outer membrane beta-barrel protein [Bryobacteraceae bacterium]|nr:outer membrane beta-barrel protein [Bryobacteraceae bacterium]
MFPRQAYRMIVAAAVLTSHAGSLCAQTEHEKALEARIEALEKRLAQLEEQLGKAPPGPKAAPPPLQAAVAPTPGPTTAPAPAPDAPPPPVDVNLMLDGYWGYNFNNPLGHINLLRAYDVLSNNFSLNQADIMVESPVDPAHGRRFGGRLDLMFGQATQTLGGNPNNEPRPQVYTNIFQAYGTYVAPLGRGLTIDFGKWASALGAESNYTKDQINYSRSYFYNFLPFYHFGFRVNYSFSDRLSAAYWLVNGANQSEDFNGAKSQNFQIVSKPVKTLAWTFNYYYGNENPSIIPIYNPGPPVLATQPGLSTNVIQPSPRGLEHIFDTYATWNATPKLTFLLEADDVIRRLSEPGPPLRVTGGAAYARYQLNDKFALATRAEYLNDHGGLFSGVTQVLKENTVTFDYLLASGLLMRAEWRRDFSNHPFFLTDVTGLLKKEQNTATLGLVWWFGPHVGAW